MGYEIHDGKSAKSSHTYPSTTQTFFDNATHSSSRLSPDLILPTLMPPQHHSLRSATSAPFSSYSETWAKPKPTSLSFAALTFRGSLGGLGLPPETLTRRAGLSGKISFPSLSLEDDEEGILKPFLSPVADLVCQLKPECGIGRVVRCQGLSIFSTRRPPLH